MRRLTRKYGRVAIGAALLAAPVASEKALAAPGAVRILVTSPAGRLKAEPGAVTLAAALAQACRDPRDNVIELDPRAFAAGNHLRLLEPMVFEGGNTGNDRLDGKIGAGNLTVDAMLCDDTGLSIGGDARIEIVNLNLRGGKQRVMLVKGAARVSLDNVALTEGAMPGLAVFGRAAVSIKSSRLSGNRTHGLEMHGEAAATLTQVELSGNGQSGLACFEHTTASARDCRLEENGEWNTVLTDSAGAELTRCLLRKARFANIDISGSARLLCQDCGIEDGQRFGLFATGESSVKLLSSRVRANLGRGIELQDTSSLELQESRVDANGDYGAILFGHSAVTARNSSISRNGAHGVSLRAGAGGVFADCSFEGNRYSGVGCLDAGAGGDVTVRRCTFRQNGMRPIYRGPLHIDPLVPTPLRIEIEKGVVRCLADPGAEIELYLDRAGEAGRYVGTLRADKNGIFEVSAEGIPEGWVLSAAATHGAATSEFNVIAGTAPGPVLEALLARTGPLSDDGGEPNLDAVLRRWKPHTHLVFELQNAPSTAVERYVRFLVQRISDWTGGSITGIVRSASAPGSPFDTVIIPLRYVSAESPQLLGRGGVTYMKWDSGGYFVPPMEILLARGHDPQESCPRVLAHEIGHAIGLCHARVGLLSRMQGSASPSQAFVNDFSPMMTFYDVLALQILHDPAHSKGLTLRRLVEAGIIPRLAGSDVAAARTAAGEPTFSPAPNERTTPPISNRP